MQVSNIVFAYNQVILAENELQKITKSLWYIDTLWNWKSRRKKWSSGCDCQKNSVKWNNLYLGAGFLVYEKNRDLGENLVECNNLNNVIRRCVGKQMKSEI